MLNNGGSYAARLFLSNDFLDLGGYVYRVFVERVAFIIKGILSGLAKRVLNEKAAISDGPNNKSVIISMASTTIFYSFLKT